MRAGRDGGRAVLRPMVCPHCGDPTVPYGGEDICECALTSCCGQPVDVGCDCDDRYDDQDEEEW